MSASGCQVAVISPTYNEAGNIADLIARLGAVLEPFPYEIIIVDDDSPDRTWERAEEIAACDPRIRVIRRRGERGLSSAVLAGMAVARADVFVVIDADLQHDERLVPAMMARVVGGDDLCVGSRRAPGGGYGKWSRRRRLISDGAAFLARRVTGTAISDPMSGFFAIDRGHYERCLPIIDALGFKILLEFSCRHQPRAISELGYVFRPRQWGETKLSARVAWDFLRQLRSLRTRAG